MPDDCIFCQIAHGNLPADTVYQDERVTAFHDVSPQASTHVLVIPNNHYESLNEAAAEQSDLLAHVLKICAHVAREQGVDGSGYRVVTNVGDEGGQAVRHLHFHVLGGQQMGAKLV